MRISEARQCLAEYQALLDLGEWEIACRWAKAGEIEDDCARIPWQTEYKTAVLILNRTQLSNEIPHTIIHELEHLRLEGHKEYVFAYDKMYELGLNRIADAILSR